MRERQRRGIGDLQSNKTLPFGLEGSHINDDTAACIRRFAETDRQHLARDAEVFHGSGQGEGVGRDDAHVADVIHHRFGVEILGIHGGRKDVGEDLEFVGDADVVSVGGNAIRYDPVADLLLFERFDHALFVRHLADPVIRFEAHILSSLN